ncbi:carbohydrate ABC transporter permease [Streptomyces sp. NBC_01808]|uniref:carbohydrate ABC transporter permease n=1 Tax=Streptomyces sp. NBC_01808 TaxID=2975947 RepID=UPI002DD80C4D|nr:carbohydrate ABC transporter permease [Streptomyces sp. NBC_01808]WSA41263.1 carbohydrate ABC transporter permease [Streptomyces sp. NBC_01808]
MTTAEPTDRPPALDKADVADDTSRSPLLEPRKKIEGAVLNVFSHGFLILWTVLAAGPLVWALMNALKDSGDILANPWGLPSSIDWANWSNAWSRARIGRYAANSLLIVAISVPLTMLFGSMAAYVLARFDFKGARIVYFTFVGGMAFPVVMALVPLFFVMKNLSLLDTRHGLIMVYIAYSMPFTIFFMTTFFRTLPSSVSEAAEIDGASHTRIFFQVMLPMAKPGLISVGIFNFLGHWNQYVLPFALNQGNEDDYVLTQGIGLLFAQAGYRSDYGRLFAGLVMAALPILIVYIIFQRQVQSGLTAGAVK